MKEEKVPADESAMKAAGKPQKQVIYEIIIGVLGDRFKPGMDARDILHGQNDYGRRVHDSRDLDRIRAAIFDGLKNGAIPTKLRSETDWTLKTYANRIMHYWLRKDKRLNGMRADGKRSRLAAYQNAIEADIQLKALNLLLLKQQMSDSGQTEIRSYIRVRKMQLFLQVCGIKPSELPEDLLVGWETESRKVA